MASIKVERNVIRLPNEPDEFVGMQPSPTRDGTVQLVVYAGNIRVYVLLSPEEAFGLGTNAIRAGEAARLLKDVVQPADAPLIAVANGRH